MYNLQNIDLFFGERHLLKGLSCTIKPGQKIGLIGRNGAGKTTLFKLLEGSILPDNGSVQLPNTCTIGSLQQFLPDNLEESIKSAALSVFGDYYKKEERLQEIEKMFEDPSLSEDVLAEITDELVEIQDQMQLSEISNPESDAEKILKGLGFQQEQLNDALSTLSGGWQMRVELAKLLLSEPDIMLLDEPTNHLDIESIIWFEQYIKKYKKTVLLISHDETFLQNTVNRIFEIELGKLSEYTGSYQKYLTHKAERKEQMESAFKNQQKVIQHKEKIINKFMAKATKTKMAQSMQKQLNKMERVEFDPEDNSAMKVRFPFSVRTGLVVAQGKDVVKNYGDKKVLRKANIAIERGDKIAFIGQNGQGKSTLLKSLLSEISIDEGEAIIGHNVNISYYAQNQSEILDTSKTVLETVEINAHPDYYIKARHILGSFIFSGEDVTKKVSVLSGGERARVALACMAANPSNFLVFDEPTNHLDVVSKNVLKQAIKDYQGTVLIVSHDRQFLQGLSTKTYEFRDNHIYEHIGDIDYVLDKRNIEDLREYSNTKKSADKVEEKKVLSYDQVRELEKTVKYLERDIQKLEADMAKIEVKMGDPSFYSQSDSAEIMSQYKLMKKTVVEKMESWEKQAEILEDSRT